jgi:hypothetical protein
LISAGGKSDLSITFSRMIGYGVFIEVVGGNRYAFVAYFNEYCLQEKPVYIESDIC